jgi:Monooxygenase af470-like
VTSTPIAESITADHDADVVVFLIGMRINRWRSVRHWVPVVLAFLPMIRELLREPSSGCRSARTFFSGRTIMAVQYWDTVDQVIAYAHDPRGKHRPAWRAFNRNATRTTAVGIFHETYSVQSGHYETIYRAMPPSGLAAATGSVAPLARRGMTAKDRLAGCPHAAGSSTPVVVPNSPAGLIAAYDHRVAASLGS